MSGSPAAPARTSERGVTLLEMLAVLAIIGAMLVVVAPPFASYIETLTFRTKVDEIGRAVSQLRLQALLGRHRIVAFAEGEGGSLGPYDPPLPEGWSVEGGPIVFLETGVCMGGTIDLTAPSGRMARIELTPPRCRYPATPERNGLQ